MQRNYRVSTLIARLALTAAVVVAGAPWAPAEEAAPNIDATLDEFVQLDPKQLVEKLKVLREEAGQQAAQAAELRAQAEARAQQAASLEQQVEALMAHVKELGTVFGMAPAPAEMEAAEPQVQLSNFADHIQPILRANCMSCHNDDTARGGLSLATFNATMEGGSSGAVVVPGDAEGSRLFRLVAHTEEPIMPPSGTKLPDEEIEALRKWINDGALANKDSKPMAKKEEESAAPEETFVAATFADTPPLPEVTLAAAQALPARGVAARAIDTSPTAPLAAVGSHQQVLLYHLETMELLGALPFPEGDVFTLTFSVNGEVLLVGGGEEGYSGTAVAYEVRTGERLQAFGQLFDTVLACDISPDHRLVALGGPNSVVRVYAWETGEVLYKLDKHTDWILAAKFTPDGEVLTTADRAGNMYFWQAANGRFVEELRGHDGAIHHLAYSENSVILASAGHDGTVQLWDTWEFKRVQTVRAHNAPVLHIDTLGNEQFLTTSTDGTAKLFGADGKEVGVFQGLGDWGYAACFDHQQPRVLAGTWAGAVRVYDRETREPLEVQLTTNPEDGTPTNLASAE